LEERRWENLHELRAVYATLLRNGFTLESKRPAWAGLSTMGRTEYYANRPGEAIVAGQALAI
jgi:hypothetical protein